ncbi:transporter substrate-binding domain-containing protein [Paucibacter sp. AS339]|uniref:substrate-binding periplasmic protein n=1 Tax=Paucibacter hankyongi TaxID=3133434 RepID=UPI0030A04FE3
MDASTQLPWAELQNNEVRSGIHRDLAEGLAAQMGLRARFMVLPRKRIVERLEQGQADIACAYLPQWLLGPFDWSEPFLPDNELVLSLRSAAMPRQLSDLAGKPIGTVSGFAYPELQRQLGAGFVREDAPTMGANLRKLEIGRMQYAVANQRYIDYQRRQGMLKLDLHPDFKVSQLAMACALSPRSELKLDRLNGAIAEFSNSGALGRLLARYR